MTGPPSRSGARRSGRRSRGCPARCRSGRRRTSWPIRARSPSTICSPTRFEAPMTLAGCTALSVEMNTKRSTRRGGSRPRARCACPARWCAPPRAGWLSRSGTCLWAAAWKTTSGPVAREHLGDALGVADVGEQLDRGASGNVAASVVQVRLVVVEQQEEPTGLHVGDLPRDLRADRPAGAGDQDPAPSRMARTPRRGRSTPARARGGRRSAGRGRRAGSPVPRPGRTPSAGP